MYEIYPAESGVPAYATSCSYSYNYDIQVDASYSIEDIGVLNLFRTLDNVIL